MAGADGMQRKTFACLLDNCKKSLGLKIIGGGAEDASKHFGIFVRQLVQGGLADRNGKLRPGDELMSASDKPLEDLTCEQAVAVLKECAQSSTVRIIASRDEQAREGFEKLKKHLSQNAKMNRRKSAPSLSPTSSADHLPSGNSAMRRATTQPVAAEGKPANRTSLPPLAEQPAATPAAEADIVIIHADPPPRVATAASSGQPAEAESGSSTPPPPLPVSPPPEDMPMPTRRELLQELDVNQQDSGEGAALNGDEQGVSSSPTSQASSHLEYPFVMICRETNLGIGVIGGINSKEGPNVYISEIVPDGDVAKDGQLKVGDQIVSINYQPMLNVKHETAVAILKAIDIRKSLKTVQIRYIRGKERQDDDDSDRSSLDNVSVLSLTDGDATTGVQDAREPEVVGQFSSRPPVQGLPTHLQAGGGSRDIDQSEPAHIVTASDSSPAPAAHMPAVHGNAAGPPVPTARRRTSNTVLEQQAQRGGAAHASTLPERSARPSTQSASQAPAGVTGVHLTPAGMSQSSLELAPLQPTRKVRAAVDEMPAASPGSQVRATPERSQRPSKEFFTPTTVASRSGQSSMSSSVKRRLSIDPAARLKVERLQMALNYLGFQPTKEQSDLLYSRLRIDDEGYVKYSEFVSVAREVFKFQAGASTMSPNAWYFASTKVADISQPRPVPMGLADESLEDTSAVDGALEQFVMSRQREDMRRNQERQERHAEEAERLRHEELARARREQQLAEEMAQRQQLAEEMAQRLNMERQMLQLEEDHKQQLETERQRADQMQRDVLMSQRKKDETERQREDQMERDAQRQVASAAASIPVSTSLVEELRQHIQELQLDKQILTSKLASSHQDCDDQRSQAHLALQAEEASRLQQGKNEETIQQLRNELGGLKSQVEPSRGATDELRKRCVVLDCQLRKEQQFSHTKEEAIEKLRSFAEKVHDTLTFSNQIVPESKKRSLLHIRGSGVQSNKTKSNAPQPPAFLAFHATDSTRSLAQEAKDTVSAVNTLLEKDPLPYGWEQAVTPAGQRYYMNHQTHVTSWLHPKTHVHHSLMDEPPVSIPP